MLRNAQESSAIALPPPHTEQNWTLSLRHGTRFHFYRTLSFLHLYLTLLSQCYTITIHSRCTSATYSYLTLRATRLLLSLILMIPQINIETPHNYPIFLPTIIVFQFFTKPSPCRSIFRSYFFPKRLSLPLNTSSTFPSSSSLLLPLIILTYHLTHSAAPLVTPPFPPRFSLHLFLCLL